jgi:hypothetical protein
MATVPTFPDTKHMPYQELQRWCRVLHITNCGSQQKAASTSISVTGPKLSGLQLRLHDSIIKTNISWSLGAKVCSRLRLKCDGTRAETKFRAKRTNPNRRGGGASVQSTTGSRCVRISGSNAGYTMFRGSMKGTGYPLHLPVSPSLPLLCVTVCHHVSTGLYTNCIHVRTAMNLNSASNI